MPQTCSGWGLESLEVYLVQQCWTQPVVGIIIILDQFLFPTCLVQSFLISKLLSVFPSFFFLFCCVPQKSLHAFSLTLVSETMWHPWELQQVYWLSFPLARTECHNMRKLALKIASYSFTNSQIVCCACPSHFIATSRGETCPIFELLTFLSLDSIHLLMFSCNDLPWSPSNNNNEYLERLTCTGPKRLHILYKDILSEFSAYNMNMHARVHTHTHTHTHRDLHTHTCHWMCRKKVMQFCTQTFTQRSLVPTHLSNSWVN